MLYHLFEYIQKYYDVPGAGLFHYISFRSAMAIILSLIISMILGKFIVARLKKLQVGETIRDLGLSGQREKEGTPTMGGLIILGAILIPTILFARLDNIYILLMLLTTVWMGLIGFIDDYIKVFKKDKKGLAGKFKIIGQVSLGMIVGFTLYFSKDVVVSKKISDEIVLQANAFDQEQIRKVRDQFYVDTKEQLTTIPFLKDHEIDYSRILSVFGENAVRYGWLVFVPVVIFIVTAVSNGANLTDGIDGLATGTSAIIGSTLGVFAYVSGNIIFADYLNIMYIPNSGELVIYSAAFIGACVGFLWYNSYPAQVFMGDTGSLAIGGIIASLAIILRKELLIPILCGIFLIENLSVMLQVSYFRYTKKKYGEGRRLFKMAPLHHHYQKLGMHESKIATRFWIVGIMLAVLSVVTLKIR
ncbi:MAG: phospho-N-acetylmuramoyl-pentapeptide-transferase [Chitinophagales bacterium]|nr:MAG: phospho-N-acetylmuramoyl-pentapeptide-transferase [Chitinophagales bacterium]